MDIWGLFSSLIKLMDCNIISGGSGVSFQSMVRIFQVLWVWHGCTLCSPDSYALIITGSAAITQFFLPSTQISSQNQIQTWCIQPGLHSNSFYCSELLTHFPANGFALFCFLEMAHLEEKNLRCSLYTVLKCYHLHHLLSTFHIHLPYSRYLFKYTSGKCARGSKNRFVKIFLRADFRFISASWNVFYWQIYNFIWYKKEEENLWCPEMSVG